jgi:hypothetical protein
VKKKDDDIGQKPLFPTTLSSKENNKTKRKRMSLEGKKHRKEEAKV